MIFYLIEKLESNACYIYTTKSMLNAGALEDELEDKRIANMEGNSNVLIGS